MESDFERHVNPTPKVYTEKEIEEKLQGYIPVLKNRLDTLEFNSHIRYYKTNGEFKCGGFIYLNPKTTKEGETFMVLKSDKFRSKGAVMWSLYYKDIKKLYVKTGMDYQIMDLKLKQRDKETQEAFNKVAAYIKKIYTRIKKIEQNTNDDTASVASGVTYMSDFLKHKQEVEEEF